MKMKINEKCYFGAMYNKRADLLVLFIKICSNKSKAI